MSVCIGLPRRGSAIRFHRVGDLPLTWRPLSYEVPLLGLAPMIESTLMMSITGAATLGKWEISALCNPAALLSNPHALVRLRCWALVRLR